MSEVPVEAMSREARVERLYARHRHTVHRLALRYGAGDVGFAEDVTHDVFMRLLGAIDRLEDDDDLGGWLYRVTANRALSRLRQDRFRRSVLALFGPVAEPPTPALERATIAREALEHTLEAVRDLPPKERVAFAMRYLDDKDQTEIAEVMGHSKGYVSKLVHRATARLRAAGWEIDDD